MAGKSILEQALLQVETLEEAVKANAKGILASTMKQELNDLLKEQEDEKDPEEEEKDVEGTEVPTDDTTPSINDEPEADEKDAEPELNDEPGDEEPDNDADDVLDMTGASEDEVLKVFKAMRPEDGIVVKKEGNKVEFSDGENDYIIKLDGEESEETPEIPGEEFPGDETDELQEQSNPDLKPAESDEIVYEIELDEDEEDQPFEEKSDAQVGKGVKKMEAKEGVNQPFDKAAPKNGVKKMQADEQAGLDHPGTPLPGTKNPQIKEPGKGGSKVTQVEKHDGTPVKGTKPAETKEPGKGGSNAKQVENHPGTPIKGEGKPVVKEPKEQTEVGMDKPIEATEAARTKWNIHGDKGKADGEPGRAGLKSKKVFKAGSGHNEITINEEVEILRKQNGEYKKALLLFKDKLNEVAVFNANLAYATRLFTEHSTTKQEKLEILKRFDTVSVITESKNLYTTIKGELETKKPLSEAVVEKIASTPKTSSTEILSEAKAYENPQFARMKDLMNKIK